MKLTSISRRWMQVTVGVSALMALAGRACAEDPAPAAGGAGLAAVKAWYRADEPLVVRIPAGATRIVLTDATGQALEDKAIPAGVGNGGGVVVDVRPLFGQLGKAGTFGLAVSAGDAGAVIGTPLVVSVRADTRRGAAPGPMVFHVVPLTYARVETDLGTMTVAFYWDAAPNSVEHFLRLAAGGFYDGVAFHRIEKGFSAQTGDPRGDGTGGPGFTVPPEFSDKPHRRGVIGLARVTDPSEGPGVPPRPEYSATGGSQWYISLSDTATRQLDKRYTVIGRVVDGLDVLEKLEQAEVDDKQGFRPRQPVTVRRVTVEAVTPVANPYPKLRAADAQTGTPSGR